MKAWELLDSPDRWCKGSYAEDADGKSLDSGKAYGACRWCVLGALDVAYGDWFSSPAYTRVRKKLEEKEGRYREVDSWNDDPERTWEDVHALLKELDI